MELEDGFEHYIDDGEAEDLYFLDEYSTSDLLTSCTSGVLNSVRYNLFLTVSFALLQKAVLCLIFFYLILMFIPPKKYIGWITTLSAFISLVLLETVVASENYSCRGILMILAMKVSSLAFDLSHNKYSVTVPEILGYLLNPCTVIFGPALPFTNYRIAFIPQSLTKKEFFVNLEMLNHFVSPITSYASGLISLGGEESPLIVRPQQVELPRSLTQVVSLWNIPMHQYLFHCKFMNIHKSCIWVNLFTVVILVDVYSRLRQFGSGVSIMGTFFISSLLHGLNSQLSIVLLSLGLHSYTEKKLRDRLSSRLSSCIRSRPCTSCTHTHPSSSIRARLINSLFSLLCIYHLIYLGMPWTGTMSLYPLSHTILIWSSHLFASHIISLSYLAFAYLL
ncbi:mom-1 [Pristionchus pacificus]|uniref:Mom-1 n=1 Tax=Pristionchus pacificus TaxID=54126 RepID=A0A2A6BG25_PRIPA|nr:mom-1 [Pristionchus pacificus]|eukprot:PDM64823.1 mom-1 [Pristionchus pacificus]